ncbi:hypothetical protein KVV02_008570, partial [Mortierella alpina]
WPTRSLTVGSLHANVKRTLNEGQESQATKDVCSVVREASAQVDELCLIMLEIVALDIDRIIGPRYQTESSSPAQGSMAGPQSTFPRAPEAPISSSSVGSSSSISQTAPMSTNTPLPSASLSTKARQQVPPNVANSLPLQLSDQERSDLLELTGTDPIFFRQLATLILKGSLGAASQYERIRKAPSPRRSSRLQTGGSASSSDEPEYLAVPHAIRAYEQYLEIVPGFVPLHNKEGAITFQPSVLHLPVDRVHLSIRQLYLGSQFAGTDGEPLKRSKDSVPIECMRPLLKHVLGGADTVKSPVDTVLNKKGILIQGLLYPVGQEMPRRSRPSGYHNKLSLQADPSPTKLKLRSVIRTNGLVLHLLAYDTKGERKPQKKDIRSATAAGQSGLYDEDEDDDTDFKLDAAFLDQQHPMSTLSKPESSSTTSYRPRPTSSTAAHTASAPTFSASRPTKSYDPTKINFARGSKTLTDVEVKFAKPEDCPDHKRARVVRVDLGERISFCATRIGPKEGERTTENEGQRETVYIRRNYLYKPTTVFRQEYQTRLQESGLDLVLSRMPSLDLGGVAQNIQYTAQHRDAIREFYHGRWYLKHAWEAAKAQRACYDYGIKAVLGLVGG